MMEMMFICPGLCMHHQLTIAVMSKMSRCDKHTDSQPAKFCYYIYF